VQFFFKACRCEHVGVGLAVVGLFEIFKLDIALVDEAGEQ
jgi:hypothetical protein